LNRGQIEYETSKERKREKERERNQARGMRNDSMARLPQKTVTAAAGKSAIIHDAYIDALYASPFPFLVLPERA